MEIAALAVWNKLDVLYLVGRSHTTYGSASDIQRNFVKVLDKTVVIPAAN